MIVLIANGGCANLEDVENFNDFNVVCAEHADLQLASQAGVGRVDGSHMWVDPEWVRRNGKPDNVRWLESFAGMIAYADKAGWIAPDGAIRAHVEGGAS